MSVGTTAATIGTAAGAGLAATVANRAATRFFAGRGEPNYGLSTTMTLLVWGVATAFVGGVMLSAKPGSTVRAALLGSGIGLAAGSLAGFALGTGGSARTDPADPRGVPRVDH